jgi:hypothetical protein
LLVVELIVFVVLQTFISRLLIYLGDLTGSQTISDRLSALAGGQSGLEASEDNRIDLYRRSLTTFLKHPIFGTFLSGGGGVGGHSFILDNLGHYGILGAVLMFWMYRTIYRCFIAPFKGKAGYGYVLWAFLQTILLSLINTGMWLTVLTLILPILVGNIYGYGELNYENPLDREYPVGLDR